ncbi:unnamed protein product, partial [Ectocarpus sp. 13 AM-2016]
GVDHYVRLNDNSPGVPRGHSLLQQQGKGPSFGLGGAAERAADRVELARPSEQRPSEVRRRAVPTNGTTRG